MKIRWWMVSAAVVGVMMLSAGFGNLIDPDDDGPLYGKLVLLAFMGAGAALILAGMILLRLGRSRGARFVAVGVLPGSIGIAFFWFPPTVVVGVLAVATSWAAFRSERKAEPLMASS